MAYTIAVANQKGGVAKTTSAVSLGAALVQTGKEVLLVDLDAQANLTMALGISPSKVRQSIADVLYNLATLASVSRETVVPGLDLVPSNQEMSLAERFLPVRKGCEFILQNALLPALPYEYVILDCPPSMGAVTLNALNAANLVVIPTQPEFFSVYALRQMITAIRQVREQSNPGLIFRILITLRDRRNRIHRLFSDQIRDTFEEAVFQSAIDIDTKLRESALAGLPILYHNPNSRSAGQYQALTMELVQYAQETAPLPA